MQNSMVSFLFEIHLKWFFLEYFLLMNVEWYVCMQFIVDDSVRIIRIKKNKTYIWKWIEVNLQIDVFPYLIKIQISCWLHNLLLDYLRSYLCFVYFFCLYYQVLIFWVYDCLNTNSSLNYNQSMSPFLPVFMYLWVDVSHIVLAVSSFSLDTLFALFLSPFFILKYIIFMIYKTAMSCSCWLSHFSLWLMI